MHLQAITLTHGQHVDVTSDNTDGAMEAENEMRGFISSIAETQTAVENMPIVKKLETAVEKDPSFAKDPELIERLAKSPQVAQVSVMPKKNEVKL
ncbi:hypothetical protein ON010_g6586 [Phytophthora cinnamomi]|nr:hypothetical protein ON010_g6586 [Phytophthora cinnamomi]